MGNDHIRILDLLKAKALAGLVLQLTHDVSVAVVDRHDHLEQGGLASATPAPDEEDHLQPVEHALARICGVVRVGDPLTNVEQAAPHHGKKDTTGISRNMLVIQDGLEGQDLVTPPSTLPVPYAVKPASAAEQASVEHHGVVGS